MEHYRQRLTFDAPPATVYAALTEPAGLRGWWTDDCDVERHIGGQLQLRFGPHQKTLRIVELIPNQRVHWHCTAAHLAVAELRRHDEWVGTELLFQLQPLPANQSQLDFSHIGLLPTLECYELCSDGWRHFLGSLQRYLAAGCGTPYRRAVTTATA